MTRRDEIEIREEPLSSLAEHARIPISFDVQRIFDIDPIDAGLGGFVLRERVVPSPYVKDYDSIDGEGPAQWANRFDTSNWGLIGAHLESERVGGVVIAFNTPGVDMLEGRADLAVVWDIRVTPNRRGQGIGALLFSAAESWAMNRGCRRLKVETQNVNVRACRFYASRACELGAIHRFAYPDLPEEVQLLWYKDLGEVACLIRPTAATNNPSTSR